MKRVLKFHESTLKMCFHLEISFVSCVCESCLKFAKFGLLCFILCFMFFFCVS